MLRLLNVLRVALKYLGGLLFRRLLGLEVSSDTVGFRLRLALEDLGLTYVKLGQYLSTRFDMLPVEVCRELNRLLEEVPPSPFSQVRTLIEEQLRAPLHACFSQFSEQCVASASVAQVYRAYTLAGERVAVKVQRPGIAEVFAADVRSLRYVAGVADAAGLLGALSMREIVDTFAAWTAKELDFRLEGRSTDRLRANARNGEIIPRVYWDLTSARVLTLEFLDGVSIARVMLLLEQGRDREIQLLLPQLDLRGVAHRLASACLHQFFVTGFFHGDPHPGNILIRQDNSVAFLDFGIFGELTEYHRRMLEGHIGNIATGNIELSFRYYSALITPTAEADMRRFSEEGKAVLQSCVPSLYRPTGDAGFSAPGQVFRRDVWRRAAQSRADECGYAAVLASTKHPGSHRRAPASVL